MEEFLPRSERNQKYIEVIIRIEDFKFPELESGIRLYDVLVGALSLGAQKR